MLGSSTITYRCISCCNTSKVVIITPNACVLSGWSMLQTHSLCCIWKLFNSHFWKLNAICTIPFLVLNRTVLKWTSYSEHQEKLRRNFGGCVRGKVGTDFVFFFSQSDVDLRQNAPITAVSRWCREHEPSFWAKDKWPGNSPDQSPIEKLWGIMQQRLNKKKLQQPRTSREGAEAKISQ